MFHMIIITVTLFIMNQGLCSEFDSVLVEIKMLIFSIFFKKVFFCFSLLFCRESKGSLGVLYNWLGLCS